MSWLRRVLGRDDRRLAQALLRRPHPLVFPGPRLIVAWSPKSACTHVVVWYLHQIGRLEAALAHHRWPHVYRNDVLRLDPMIVATSEARSREGAPAAALLKVMREPFARAVSSYRHAVRSGYADEEMSRVLGRPLAGREGLSFRVFLDFLDRIDFDAANPHHGFQSHPIDALPFGRRFLIVADGANLYEGLNRIETFFDLPKTDFDAVPAFSMIEKRHFAQPRPPADATGDILDRPLRRRDALEGWPKIELEASEEARLAVRRLYARDYETIERMRGDAIA